MIPIDREMHHSTNPDNDNFWNTTSDRDHLGKTKYWYITGKHNTSSVAFDIK